MVSFYNMIHTTEYADIQRKRTMKTIEAIISEIKANEELQKKLAEAAKNNALAEFLKEQGCEATAEEFIAAVKNQATELNDEKLATVTGGAITEALLSVMSVGIGCAVAAIVSVAIDDGAEKTEGRLLCEKGIDDDIFRNTY